MYPSVRFLTRYDGEVSEPLVGRRGSRVSMRVARGSASLDNPLQYSCLGNPMDREAWQAIVHGVTKSRTRLSD